MTARVASDLRPRCVDLVVNATLRSGVRKRTPPNRAPTCDDLGVAVRRDAGEVRRLLTAALRLRLAPAGWELLEPDDHDPFRVAAFCHPLGEQWAATCELGRTSMVPRRPSLLVTRVQVGVSYEPLRRLSTLLDLYDVDVWHERVWPATGGGAAEKGAADPWKVATDQEIERAAERSAGMILARAVPFAQRHADLEALLERFSQSDTDDARLTCAALQATAGRCDEARRSLTRMSGSPPSGRSRAIRRAARQLDRWMDSGGSPSLIPRSRPPRRFANPPAPGHSEMRAQTRAERAAVDEVRARLAGESREQARRMLLDALSRHGVERPRPLFVEHHLDHLGDSREHQFRRGVQVARTMTGLGLKAAKAIRDRELPTLAPPDWLEPPSHALYAVSYSGLWTAAQLDPDARPYLDRIDQAAPHLFGLVNLTAWIRPAGDTTDAAGVIEVALGTTRVGRIAATDAPLYERVLSDAAARDENPCLEASLSLHQGEYLLEIMTPSDPA